jgi:hypothetical protein
MAEGKSRRTWEHTSHVLAIVAAAMGGEAFEPDRWNPWVKYEQPVVRGRDGVMLLAAAFGAV